MRTSVRSSSGIDRWIVGEAMTTGGAMFNRLVSNMTLSGHLRADLIRITARSTATD